MNRWIYGQKDGRRNGWMDGWKDGRIGGWKDRQMKGWIHFINPPRRKIYTLKILYLLNEINSHYQLLHKIHPVNYYLNRSFSLLL